MGYAGINEVFAPIILRELCCYLEDEGYDVDVIEFIDFAHSPKNLMLRCHRTGHRGTKNSPSPAVYATNTALSRLYSRWSKTSGNKTRRRVFTRKGYAASVKQQSC